MQRAIQGEVATKMYAPDQQLDVRVMFPRVDRSSAEDVARIQVGISNGVPVLLSSVARVEPARGPSEIRRIDGRRGLRISAQTTSVDLGALAERVQAVLDEHGQRRADHGHALFTVLMFGLWLDNAKNGWKPETTATEPLPTKPATEAGRGR